jgi:hypothetical protein
MQAGRDLRLGFSRQPYAGQSRPDDNVLPLKRPLVSRSHAVRESLDGIGNLSSGLLS